MRICSILLLLTGVLACQAPQKEVQAQKNALDALELQLLQAQDVNLDTTVAVAFLEKSQAFVEAFPSDSLSPFYLFKAAEVSRGLRRYGDAIYLAGRAWREYPEFEKVPDAIFLQGFIYDTDLGDTTNAKVYYKQFLEKYPDHPFAANVNQLLSVLGRDPEALIQQFQKETQEE